MARQEFEFWECCDDSICLVSWILSGCTTTGINASVNTREEQTSLLSSSLSLSHTHTHTHTLSLSLLQPCAHTHTHTQPPQNRDEPVFPPVKLSDATPMQKTSAPTTQNWKKNPQIEASEAFSRLLDIHLICLSFTTYQMVVVRSVETWEREEKIEIEASKQFSYWAKVSVKLVWVSGIDVILLTKYLRFKYLYR